MKRIDKLRAAEHAVRAAIEEPQVLNTDEARRCARYSCGESAALEQHRPMKTLNEMRAYSSAPPRRAPRRKKSEAADQKSAQFEKRKIEVTRKARVLLKRFEELNAAGIHDDELRRMRDEMVQGLWALRTRGPEVKGLTTKVLTMDSTSA